MSDAIQRLSKFLLERGLNRRRIEPISPDASTREYFRIDWDAGTAIACVYPAGQDPALDAYLDVSNLFKLAKLPVADVLDFDRQSGIVIQEDLGNTTLNALLQSVSTDEAERLINKAIDLIARIQAATSLAISLDSIGSRQKFDFDKLFWELEFFFKHFTETLQNRPLEESVKEAIYRDFHQLAEELGARAAVLCHRDFHSFNVMIDSTGELRIIDHQDARIGSPTYDLVSLLLDRITAPPDAGWIREKQAELLAARLRLGLQFLDPEQFDREFRLQAIQRCLKAVGTFSYQTAARGKSAYRGFIRPMLAIAADAARSLDKFPALVDFLDGEIIRPEKNPPASF